MKPEAFRNIKKTHRVLIALLILLIIGAIFHLIGLLKMETQLYEAYFQVIRKLSKGDNSLGHSSTRYIAIDMTGVFENEREPLEKRLRSWAESLNCELLIGTYEELTEAGYVEAGFGARGFKSGVLFRFSNGEINNHTFTVEASKFRGSTSGNGGFYSVRCTFGIWTVKPIRGWIA